MSIDQLKQAKQLEILRAWQEEIDTAISRLTHSAANATRAVEHWQSFAAISDQQELAATGQSVAVELLGRETGSLTAIATLCQTFAAATGQTNEQIITKLTAALSS